jgi:hypothetical protein
MTGSGVKRFLDSIMVSRKLTRILPGGRVMRGAA